MLVLTWTVSNIDDCGTLIVASFSQRDQNDQLLLLYGAIRCFHHKIRRPVVGQATLVPQAYFHHVPYELKALLISF
jgi:hypothetical protein